MGDPSGGVGVAARHVVADTFALGKMVKGHRAVYREAAAWWVARRPSPMEAEN
jgi:hypothetical protein